MRGLKAKPEAEPGAEAPEGYAVLLENVTKTYGAAKRGAGRITVGPWELAGLKQRRLAEYRRTVGFVFQRFHLLPALTALDNVIAPVLPYRTAYDKRARARELLAAVGLGGRGDSLPSRSPAAGSSGWRSPAH